MQTENASVGDASSLRLLLEQMQAISANPRKLRPLLRQVCLDAREKQMSVASLIIFLKDSWRSLPDSEFRTASRNELLDRVISICIEEYYDGHDAPEGGRA